MQRDGRELWGVAGQQETEWLGGHELAEQGEQGREVIFDLEDLPLGTATVARGIEDDEIILALAALLALEEFGDVIDDPADGFVIEPIQRGVLARPIDHALAGINMADFSTAMGSRESAATGVGEEIQHTWCAPVLF